MPAPKLLDIIRDKSDRFCAEILDRNNAEAENIIEKARNAAEEMRRDVLRKVHAESNRLRERKYNTIRFRSNARRYRLKAKALEEVWSETENIIGKIEHSEGYKGILEKLFFECLSDVPDGSEVRVAPDGVSIIRDCISLSGRNLSLREDPLVHGGVEFRWPQGKIALKNTLSYRLSRLKAEGNAELTSILFASEENVKG